MQRYIKTETFYLRPCDKIVSKITSIGDEQGYTTSVKATVTDWNLEIPQLENYLNVLYPKHQVQELWGCTYRQGDYAEAHNHFGFDLAFVWFVDTCSHCSSLIFPDIKHPWLDHEAVIKPRNGMLYVFTGKDIHYVEPHTCNHERIIMSGNVRRSINKTVSPIDNPWH